MVGIITKSLENKMWEVTQFGKDRDNGTRESLNQIMILEFPTQKGIINSNTREEPGRISSLRILNPCPIA